MTVVLRRYIACYMDALIGLATESRVHLHLSLARRPG